MLDMEKLGSEIANMVKSYVSDAFKQLNDKVDGLILEKGEKGDKGEDGKSIELSDVMPHIKSLVIAEINDLPKPEKGDKGEDGLNGKDADPIDADFIVDKLYHKLFSSDEFASRIVKLIPVPQNGKDGKDGVNGKDASEIAITERVLANIVIPEPIKGEKGDKGDNADIDFVKDLVIKAVSELPLPKDGKDGQNGKDGTSVYIDDLKPHLDASIAKWQLDFERIAYDTLQKSVAAFPKPEKGDKGEDGFGIESFEQVDERTVKAVYRRGDEVIEKEFKFPTLIYRNVFKQGNYEKGDAVTFGGAIWIAKKDTDKAPTDGEDWQLAVRRGKDANKA